MKCRPIVLLSPTSNFRTEMIAKGVIAECHRLEIPFLWKKVGQMEATLAAAKPRGVVISGNAELVRQIWTEAGDRYPIINTYPDSLTLPIPAVLTDSVAVTRSAIAHLIEEGARDFIFVGPRVAPEAAIRAKCFRNVLREYGLKGQVFDAGLDKFWGCDIDRGHRFIRLLQKSQAPIGVLACNDRLATCCIECVQLTGLKIPRDVLVVGCEDHPIFAAMYLPLTSYRVDLEGIGRIAVEMILQRQPSSGKSPSPHERRYVQGELIPRDSSRRRLSRDARISKVLAHIYREYHRQINLAELAREAGISRSVLSARFRAALGESVMRYLARYRIETAKKLLDDQNLTIAEVACRVGFLDKAHFTRAFKKAVALTPTEFRTMRRRQEISLTF